MKQNPQQNSDSRIPPGQHRVDDFPVLDLGIKPEIHHDDWQLVLFGEVANEISLSWKDLQALPQTTLTADFHCVTTWSRLDLVWEGVAASHVIRLAAPLATARFVTLHSYDGYSTNLPLSALLGGDDAIALIAHTVDGGPLSVDHGGPVRLVVPGRYGWKSAKWLRAIEFHAEDRPGFWEVRGYHNDADPWNEERYSENT